MHVEPPMSMEFGNPFALIEALLRHNVPFVVIGDYAVVYHGYVRATEDVDIVFNRSYDSELSLLAALTEVEAEWVGNDINPMTGIEGTCRVSAEYIARTHLMMLCTRRGYLDIFDYVPGFPDEAVEVLFQTAVRANGIPFVSLDWLKRMKQAAARPKDQEDLRQLP